MLYTLFQVAQGFPYSVVAPCYFFRMLVCACTANDVGAAAVKAMMDDAESWCLVKEFREFTNEILMEPGSVGMKELKKTVRKVSQEKLLLKYDDKTPLIAELGRMSVWGKLWEHAMDLGEKHTRGYRTSTD